MTFTHITGTDSGIEYVAVRDFLLWIVAIIVLVIVFAVKGVHGGQ